MDRLQSSRAKAHCNYPFRHTTLSHDPLSLISRSPPPILHTPNSKLEKLRSPNFRALKKNCNSMLQIQRDQTKSSTQNTDLTLKKIWDKSHLSRTPKKAIQYIFFKNSLSKCTATYIYMQRRTLSLQSLLQLCWALGEQPKREREMQR